MVLEGEKPQSVKASELRQMVDPVLVKAMAHPLRLRILTALDNRVASPRELATELNARLGTVSYHVRTLADLELIRQVRTQTRRGAVEHFYEVSAHWAIPDDIWSELPDVLRQSVVRSVLTQVALDLNGADFGEQRAHLTRTKLELDQTSRDELASLFDTLLVRLHELSGETQQRLQNRDGSASPVEIETVMMSFRVRPSASTPDA